MTAVNCGYSKVVGMMRGTIQLVSTRGETIRYIVFECIAIQGRRKQFFSGQPNQPHSYIYREFTMTGGHKCKLLCESGGMSPRRCDRAQVTVGPWISQKLARPIL